MKQLSICIDIDGTVTDAYYWLKPANEFFNLSVEPEEIRVYDIPTALGIHPDDYDAFYIRHGVELHRQAEIRSGVKQVIDRLYHYHQIHFVSARSTEMLDVSVEWFRKHQLAMDTMTLLGSHDKVSRAIDLLCDVFIEDRYENAIQLARAGMDVLLVDTTYNQGILPSNVTRVTDWHEIELIIRKISQQSTLKLAQ